MKTLTPALALALFVLLVPPAHAQDKPTKPAAELEVTMQIIVDPDAKVPEAVVRRIKLPTPQTRSVAEAKQGERKGPPEDAAALGKEISERAREMAREAAENREELGRSIAEEARRNAPPQPPAPPVTPPGRP